VARVAVESYAGFKADERPVRLKLGGETLPVVEVEDRWYSPGETFFRVRVEAATVMFWGTRRRRISGAWKRTGALSGCVN